MSNAKKPAAKGPEGGDGKAAPAEKKGMSMVLVIGLVVGALGIGGGGAWWFASSKAHADAEAAAVAADDEHEDEGEGEGEDTSKAEDKKSQKKKKKKRPTHGDGPAEYLSLEPGFIVNLSDGDSTRYLQANIDVMARDPKVIEEAKLHMPAIRNSLLMLFGQKSASDLQSIEQREALREEVLEKVQEVMEEETGEPGVEQVFFTAFVIQ